MSEFAGIVQDELRDLRGNALTGATVIVRDVGTTTPATVYNNPVQISAAGSGDTLTNDATTGIPAASGLLQPGVDANANYTFFADSDVAYDLHVVWHGLTFDYRVRPKVTHEEAGGSTDLNIATVLQFPTNGDHTGHPAPAHVNHGHFWPATTDLGPFMWMCWCAPSIYSEFWASESASGAHALLVGFANLAPIGNIWNGVLSPSQGGIGFAGDYVAAEGEWLHDSLSWDGAHIYRHINGVCVGRWAFAGPRQAFSGNLYIGGSDHSNFENGKIIQVKGVELAVGATSGLPIDFATLSAVFRPEIPMGDWSGPGDVVGVKASFLATYSRPALTVPDESNGYGGLTHSGILSGKAIAFGPYPGQEGHPKPSWVADPTCPFRTDVLPASLALVPTPIAVPSGARIWDSGGRANSDFAFSPIPSIGSTEGGSLGPLAWSGDGEVGVNSAHWVLQRGQAVYAGSYYGIKLVDNGSPEMDVRVTRRLVGGYLHHTGCAARAVDEDNGWFANTYQQFGTEDPQHVIVRIAPFTAGVSASPTDYTAPATLWSILRVVASLNTITVYVDDLAGGWTQLGQLTGQFAHQTATKCGMFTGISDGGMHRFFPFHVRSTGVSSPAAPAAPTGLTATATGNTTIDLSWSAAGGATAYLVYRGTVTGGPYTLIVTQAGLTLTDTGRSAATAYFYVVKAQNSGGSSANSTQATATTDSGATAPDAPTIGTATAGDTTATANWTAGSNGGSAITDYQIKTYSSSGTLLATDLLGGTGLTFTKTGLTNGTAVKFKVAAINAIDTGTLSAFSNTVTPASFSPAALPNVVRWGDPQTLAAGALASYADSSAAGTTLAQATSGKRPVVVDGELSGKKIVRFDGVDDFLVSADFGSAKTQPTTAVLVVKLNGVPTNTAKLIDGGGAGRNALYVDPDAFSGVREALYIYAGSGGGSSSLTAHAPNGVWVIILVEFNAASSRYYVNGGTAATGVGASGDTDPQGRITLACDSGQGAHFTGADYADDIFIDGLLTVSEKNQLGAWLVAQYPALTWNTVSA